METRNLLSAANALTAWCQGDAPINDLAHLLGADSSSLQSALEIAGICGHDGKVVRELPPSSAEVAVILYIAMRGSRSGNVAAPR